MLIGPSISGTASFLLWRYWQCKSSTPIVPREPKSYSSSQSTSVNPSQSILTICVKSYTVWHSGRILYIRLTQIVALHNSIHFILMDHSLNVSPQESL